METKAQTITAVLDSEVLKVQPKKPSALRVIDDEGNVNIEAISDEDKRKYSQLTKNLSVKDINSVSNYGSDLQNVMNKYSSEFLTAVRSHRGGEIGELVNDLLNELGYIDVDELREPSIFKKIARKMPIIRHFVTSLKKVLNKYDSIANNVDAIAKKIEATRLTSLRDNNALQVMFDNNIKYGQYIDELIVAGKLKLEEVNAEIQHMIENSSEYESHQIQDMQEFSHNLERRIYDMLTLRYVIKQSLPQIRTVQYNNIAIADKAQSIIATTIPVWKNQLSIAVALNNQKGRIEAHRRITDTTNTILQKNAELLKQNSIEVARENERSVVDIETLRDTTRKLIDTVKEVKAIHDEATAKRKEAEVEIMKIESELDSAMTSMRNEFKQLY